MEIKSKYKVGDKAFIIYNDKIEQATVEDFKLENDQSATLEERLRYVVSSSGIKEHQKFQSSSMYVWYYLKNVRKESEMFDTIKELLKNLEDEYNRQS